MLEKLKPHFVKFGPRRFVVVTVLLLLILDIMNSYYLRLYWEHRNLSILLTKTLAMKQGLDFSHLSSDSIQEVKGVVDQAFFFFLFIVLINNIFFYVFYLRRKLWAQSFVLFYAISNSVLAITFLIEGPILGIPWFLYNLGTMFLYLYLYLGIKLLKHETTDIIPEGGRKAR
jgi:hypothetical protein